jgi:glycine cleavage system H protein
MSNVPKELRYAKSHEWLKSEADGTATVGITDYAQNSLGDITFVQLPKVGAVLKAGESFGVVESVKAASDVFAPIGGTVTAVNSALDKTPETLNRDPYAEGWILKLKASNPGDAASLLDADGYAKLTG